MLVIAATAREASQPSKRSEPAVSAAAAEPGIPAEKGRGFPRPFSASTNHPHLEWPQLGQVMQPSTMRIPY